MTSCGDSSAMTPTRRSDRSRLELQAFGGYPIDFSEFLQKFWITIIEANDLAKLGAVTCFVLDHFAPDFDLSEQQHPVRTIVIFSRRPDHVPKGINAVRLHITGGWLVGEPDIISHINAAKPVIAIVKPIRGYHAPSTIRNDLSRANALVFEPPSKLVVTWVHYVNEPDRHLGYFAGSGSGLVTGAGLPGALLGGGGKTASAVGETGSSTGITV